MGSHSATVSRAAIGRGASSIRSVVICDPDPEECARLARQLRSLGVASCVPAPDLATAITAGTALDAPQLEADMMVLEPNVGGRWRLDLIETIHRARPTLKLVIVSASASLALACAVLRRGAYACLAKPADPMQILAAAEEDDPTGGGEAPRMPTLARAQWEYMQWALFLSGGNKSRAARSLGLRRTSLQRKLAKHPPR